MQTESQFAGAILPGLTDHIIDLTSLRSLDLSDVIIPGFTNHIDLTSLRSLKVVELAD